MGITIEELIMHKGLYGEVKKYDNGYRIVYFYEDGHHEMGAYCKSIEGFMVSFTKSDPIEDDDDIPEFISTEDLLNRYLTRLPKVSAVAIFKTDGTMIAKKDREKLFI